MEIDQAAAEKAQAWSKHMITAGFEHSETDE